MKIKDFLEYLDNEKIEYTFTGNAETQIEGFSSLANYKKGSMTWIKKQENLDEAAISEEDVLFAVVDESVNTVIANVIRTKYSKIVFFAIIENFLDRDDDDDAEMICSDSYISPKVKLGKNVRIGHNCTIDGNIEIGDNTVIWHNVVIIGKVHIGNNCVIQSGTIIGHDSMAFSRDENGNKVYVKQHGGVYIGNNVAIYDQVCIGRGTIDDTVIEDNVSVSGNSRIAHNCHVGANSTFTMRCQMAGSSSLGSNSKLCHTTVLNQVSVGNNVESKIGSVILTDVEDNSEVFGYPARKVKTRT